MADLSNTQAKQYSETRPIYAAKEYSETRPIYPSDLFQFISSKTPNFDLAWDVGTGNGQAARSLAEIYNKVVATDISEQQLLFAPKHPKIRYQHTHPNISIQDLERDVAAHETVDLVTVAQAVHWFDLPTFYDQVKWVLRKPHGVIAVWCYTEPQVDQSVDRVFKQLYYHASEPYFAEARKKVDEEYRSIDFPFEPVEGTENTGPFEFLTERVMDLDGYFTYIKSWSAYETARAKGVELLSKDVIEDFGHAWGDGSCKKAVRFPVFLRIGQVGK